VSNRPTGEPDNIAKPGPILKALRLQKGWRLADVAARTGFPVSTLSNMENGKVGLNYEKIARLSKGMNVDIGVFFAEEAVAGQADAGSGRRSINRGVDGRLIETHAYENRFLATDLLNKRFVPIITEVFARSIEEFGELSQHSGEEFTYVLEGALEVHTKLYAPVRLEAGESIYFDSGTAHGYVAVGEGRCRALTICSGEESQLITLVKQNSGSPRGAKSVAAPVRRAAKHAPIRK